MQIAIKLLWHKGEAKKKRKTILHPMDRKTGGTEHVFVCELRWPAAAAHGTDTQYTDGN